jgi:hypothetical protein
MMNMPTISQTRPHASPNRPNHPIKYATIAISRKIIAEKIKVPRKDKALPPQIIR